MAISGFLAIICGLALPFLYRGLLSIFARFLRDDGGGNSRSGHGIAVVTVCLFVSFGLVSIALAVIVRSFEVFAPAFAIAFIAGVGASRFLLREI